MPKLQTYWQVFWRYRQMQLLYLLEYRANFFFWTFVSTMWSIFNFFVLGLVNNVSNGIAGWTPVELQLLLGIFTMIDAFTWSFFYHNMVRYTQKIFDGSFNLDLLKPLDTQFLIMTAGNSYTNIPRFLIGLGVVIYSLIRLQWQFNLLVLGVAIILMIAALIVIYSLWFIMSTYAFWVEKLDNINEVIPAFNSVYKFPRQIFSGLLSLIFTWIVPLTLLTSGPAEILLGKGSLLTSVFLALSAVAIFLLSRWWLFFSVKRYSGIAN